MVTKNNFYFLTSPVQDENRNKEIFFIVQDLKKTQEHICQYQIHKGHRFAAKYTEKEQQKTP